MCNVYICVMWSMNYVSVWILWIWTYGSAFVIYVDPMTEWCYLNVYICVTWMCYICAIWMSPAKILWSVISENSGDLCISENSVLYMRYALWSLKILACPEAKMPLHSFFQCIMNNILDDHDSQNGKYVELEEIEFK